MQEENPWSTKFLLWWSLWWWSSARFFLSFTTKFKSWSSAKVNLLTAAVDSNEDFLTLELATHETSSNIMKNKKGTIKKRQKSLETMAIDTKDSTWNSGIDLGYAVSRTVGMLDIYRYLIKHCWNQPFSMVFIYKICWAMKWRHWQPTFLQPGPKATANWRLN